MKKVANIKGLTLVELLVVISVLAILSVISFGKITGVTSDARNATRKTNIINLHSALTVYSGRKGVYPMPDEKVDILYSGSVIGYQGYAKDGVLDAVDFPKEGAQDPIDPSLYLSYAISADRTKVQVLGWLEKETKTTSFGISQAYANTNLTNRTPFSKGNKIGIIFLSGTLTPIQDTGSGVDVAKTNTAYTAYFSEEETLSGTGKDLQNLSTSYTYGKGLASPLVQDCPVGFVAVPGSSEFNQPGFCVAKYEMKQAVGNAGVYTTSGTGWALSGSSQSSPYCIAPTAAGTGVCSGTGARSFSGQIISKPEGYPIVWLNQYNAMKACESLGAGYHLITNNEWMTIARNIEKTASNWSSGITGSGYIFSGHNDGAPANALAASADDNNGYVDTGNSSGSQKRTHKLSNGQVIWDFAGNVLEHVNKGNTINGIGYNSSSVWTSNVCGGSNWYSFYGNDSSSPCTFQSGYSYSVLGPTTFNLNSLNGIGRIFSYTTSPGDVFLRGGHWKDGANAGVFSLTLFYNDTFSSFATGFRCVK